MLPLDSRRSGSIDRMVAGSSDHAGQAGEQEEAVRPAGAAGPSLSAVAEEPDNSPSSSFDGSGLRTPTPGAAQLRQQPPWPSANARTMAPPGRGLLSYSRPANVEVVPAQAPKTPSEGPGGSKNAVSPTSLAAPGSSSSRRESSGAGPSASPQRPKGRVGKGMPLVRPPPSASQNAGQRRGVIASSLDLVFSYSRSHAFFGDNLPSSPSFVAHYRRPGYRDEEESSFLGTDSSEEYSDEGEDEEETSRHSEFGERLSLSSSMSPVRDEDSQEEALPPNATARLVTEERRRGRRRRSRVEDGGRQLSAASDAYDADDNADQDHSVDEREPASERTDLLPSSARARASYGALRLSDDEDGLARVPSQPPLDTQPSPHFSDSTTKLPLASQPKSEERSGVGESTFGQTLFNSFNVLCGVGLLSEPLAFASAGWIGGAGLLAFCGLVTNYTYVDCVSWAAAVLMLSGA